MNASILSLRMKDAISESPMISLPSVRLLSVSDSYAMRFVASFVRMDHAANCNFRSSNYVWFLSTPISISGRREYSIISSRSTPVASNSVVSVSFCLFKSCVSAYAGGGLYVSDSSATVSVTDSIFWNCYTSGTTSTSTRSGVSGGGYICDAGSVMNARLCMMNCTGTYAGYVCSSTSAISGINQFNCSYAGQSDASSMTSSWLGVVMDKGYLLTYSDNITALKGVGIAAAMHYGGNQALVTNLEYCTFSQCSGTSIFGPSNYPSSSSTTNCYISVIGCTSCSYLITIWDISYKFYNFVFINDATDVAETATTSCTSTFYNSVFSFTPTGSALTVSCTISSGASASTLPQKGYNCLNNTIEFSSKDATVYSFIQKVIADLSISLLCFYN